MSESLTSNHPLQVRKQKNNIVDKSKQNVERKRRSSAKKKLRSSKNSPAIGVVFHTPRKNKKPTESNKGVQKRELVNEEIERKKTQDKISSVILDVFEQLCREHNIPENRARKAARKAVRTLLADKFRPELTLPSVAPAKWFCRSEEDHVLTPIQFQEKYWSAYIDEEVLFQADLRRLDSSLFNALKGYCKNNGLNPNDYLPLPARKKMRSVVENSPNPHSGKVSNNLTTATARPAKPRTVIQTKKLVPA